MFFSKTFTTWVMFAAMAIRLSVGSVLAAEPAASEDAQQQSDPQGVTSRTVVVSATGYEQDILDAPASISIITREELLKRPFNNLADAIKDIPGLSYVGSSGNEKDILIRGMPAEYTLILVDGKRQGTRDSRPNGSAGFEASWIPPLSAIDRIEVIRGPMSALYGSDAMGGVINIITRKHEDTWRASLGMDYTLQQHSESGNIFNGNFFLSGPLWQNKIAMQVYGTGHFRQEDDIPGGFSKYDNKNVTGKLILSPVEKHDIILEAGQAYQKREVTPGKSQSVGSLVRSYPKYQRTHWAATYEADWSFMTSKLSLYQERGKRNYQSKTLDPGTGSWNFSGSDRKPEVVNTVHDGMVTIPLPMNMLSLGWQYQHDKLNDDSSGRAGGNRISVTAEQWALFAEDEFSITNDLILTAGLRYDHHEFFGARFSPRGYLVYHLTPEWTLKGGVSTAFRAPGLRQINPNYGTATQQGRAVLYGEEGLKPETSTTEELGIIYHHDNTGITASVTGFHTNFRNKITNYNTGTVDPDSGLNLFKYTNIGKARLMGVESAVTIPFLDKWKLSGSYTYTYSKRRSDEELFGNGSSTKGQPLTMTPKHKADAKLEWAAFDNFSTYVRGEYNGKQNYSALRSGNSNGPRMRDAFMTFDWGASYAINEHVMVNAAVLNIFDERETDFNDLTGADWDIVEDGRRFWLGITLNF